jgi:histidinol-phosphate/aromatic aminotransferase/cobyric acid decarboxylase-like protein
VKLDGGLSGKALRNRLLERHGIVVRECGNKLGATDNHLRLAVNGREANELLAERLAETLGEG